MRASTASDPQPTTGLRALPGRIAPAWIILFALLLLAASGAVVAYFVWSWARHQLLPFGGAYFVLMWLVLIYNTSYSANRPVLRLFVLLWYVVAAGFLDVILVDAIPEQIALVGGRFRMRPIMSYLWAPVVLNAVSALLLLVHFFWLGRGWRVITDLTRR